MKKYYALYKKQFILGPAFKLAEAILELLVPLVMAKIIDVGIKNGDVPYIIKMGLLMASLGILGLLSVFSEILYRQIPQVHFPHHAYTFRQALSLFQVRAM